MLRQAPREGPPVQPLDRDHSGTAATRGPGHPVGIVVALTEGVPRDDPRGEPGEECDDDAEGMRAKLPGLLDTMSGPTARRRARRTSDPDRQRGPHLRDDEPTTPTGLSEVTSEAWDEMAANVSTSFRRKDSRRRRPGTSVRVRGLAVARYGSRQGRVGRCSVSHRDVASSQLADPKPAMRRSVCEVRLTEPTTPPLAVSDRLRFGHERSSPDSLPLALAWDDERARTSRVLLIDGCGCRTGADRVASGISLSSTASACTGTWCATATREGSSGCAGTAGSDGLSVTRKPSRQREGEFEDEGDTSPGRNASSTRSWSRTRPSRC